MREKYCRRKFMTNEEILREIGSLPPEGKRIVESFLAFLQQRYAHVVAPATNAPLQDENFIGMWSDRVEMADSTTWVRGIRESEWGH
jgi:hypothetical protein